MSPANPCLVSPVLPVMSVSLMIAIADVALLGKKLRNSFAPTFLHTISPYSGAFTRYGPAAVRSYSRRSGRSWLHSRPTES